MNVSAPDVHILITLWTLVDVDPRGFNKRLRKEVQDADFRKTEETAWAYAKVASFLEDGWESARRYVTRKRGCPIKPDEFGHLVNRVVAGTRWDRAEAERHNAQWLNDGEWPTRADMAAYLYFLASESPPW